MLSSLKIENVAVIESSEIIFDSGLNILTGETGAGKSIVIDSINMILGERTFKDIIRTGADRAKVTAYFENVSGKVIKKLEEAGVDCQDDTSLLITRIINSDGRNICKVNGCNVTVSMLRVIGRDLITICGQHDSQYLLDKEHHLDFIDAMADIDELYDSYKEAFIKLKEVKKQLKGMLTAEDEREQRIEFLKFQIDELMAAEIKIGEKDRLTKERDSVRNRENILRRLGAVDSIISGNDESTGLKDSLHALIENINELSKYDDSFSQYKSGLDDFKYLIDECASSATAALGAYDSGYVDADAIEERLDELYRLSRKYGSTEEEMLLYLNRIVEEYNELVMRDEKIEELQEKYNELSDEVFKRGCYLSDCRKQTAIDFEDKVKTELCFLDMPDASFCVDFKEAKATLKGMDDVEFLFSANAGQDMKPLAKIASGGELSRVMLAIRCVLSGTDEISSMIFDEIDTGVSGRAAHKIAYKMHGLSVNKQILCVTHLAQIAAYADNHLYIEKITDGDTAYTKVSALSEDDRVRELARIIGGDIVSSTTLESARELIEYARNN